jgi:hypothetical protein
MPSEQPQETPEHHHGRSQERPRATDGPISDFETFQMITEVLVRGDSAWYVPTQTPNTHWSNWPEGGTL